MVVSEKFVTELLHLFNHITCQLDRLEESIMATQEELATQLEALNTSLSNVTTQLAEVSIEIQNASAAQTDAITELQEQLQNAANVSPQVQAAMDAVLATSQTLVASVQTLDDINPDAPVPVPVEPAA